MSDDTFNVIVTKVGQDTRTVRAETVGEAVDAYGDYSGYLLTLDGSSTSRDKELTRDGQVIVIGEKCKGA